MRHCRKHNESQHLDCDSKHHMQGKRRHDDCLKHHHRAHNHSPLLRGRKFNSEDIQLLIRSFLSTQSSYGYELIKQFSNRTNEAYTPSPGVIYPALTYLEEIEHIASQMEGTRKRYTLTKDGLDYLHDHKEVTDRLLAILDNFAQRMESVNEAMQDNDERKIFVPELGQAISELRSVLRPRNIVNEETQKQMVIIINEAIEKLKQL